MILDNVGNFSQVQKCELVVQYIQDVISHYLYLD